VSDGRRAPRFDWDEAKRAINIAKHGLDFASMEFFAWDLAIVRADLRHHYGEVRLIATAPLAGRIAVLVYTIRERALRIISLRHASDREIDRYAKEFQP
jgi:uncharacterized DUF497 family protein